MKKTLILTAALALAGVASLKATTVDVYITGSTAFRANVYTACTKLFVGGTPNIYYADSIHGGANSSFSSKTASWVMSGSPVSTLTNLQGNTLVVHGNFTGSIQGIATVENDSRIVFAQPVGTLNNNATVYITNSATIGFSDASGSSCPYPAVGNYVEENVCVQPFVFVKSTAATGAVTNINNVTFEQVNYGIPQGRIPLSAWTTKMTDTNSWVYLYERSKDSGTRRCFTSGGFYSWNASSGATVYNYDYTNNVWYTPTVATNFGYGYNMGLGSAGGAGVIGTEGPGYNNANMVWGYGYIGGGDIANSLNNNSAANQGIAYLSIADAKSVGASNWAEVVTYNGIWPTAAGAGLHGNTGTNDFSPITLGYYPLWGLEVLVHPVDPSLVPTGDQDITATELGSQTQPGTFMGVFNSQTLINGGSPLTGSVENEILLSEPTGATGVRLSEMIMSRPSVGGTIYPPFN